MTYFVKFMELDDTFCQVKWPRCALRDFGDPDDIFYQV
jgi:hypothetical protein